MASINEIIQAGEDLVEKALEITDLDRGFYDDEIGARLRIAVKEYKDKIKQKQQ